MGDLGWSANVDVLDLLSALASASTAGRKGLDKATDVAPSASSLFESLLPRGGCA